MAAEDAVVDGMLQVLMKLVVMGTDVGLKITGAGAKAIGVSFYALAKHIAAKRQSGKALTPGEIQFEKLIKSGEEIHSIWLPKDDLKNFSQIAKQMGVTFTAIKNGDELAKAHKFLSHKDKNGETVEFAEHFKDMVSISYLASDEVRMAHILEMFNTFNKSETVVESPIKEKESFVDEVEEFMKENGVEVERPPEVVEAEEVNQQKSQASEKDLISTDGEIKQAENSGSVIQICFEEFGFDKQPTQAEYDNAYIKRITESGINPAEPNYITALYEQGSKIIKNLVTQKVPLEMSDPIPRSETHKIEVKEKAKESVPECFTFFGFDEVPTVDELKKAYTSFIEKNGKTEGSNIVDNMYQAAGDLINKPNEDNLRFCYEFFGFDHKPSRAELDAAYKAYDAKSVDTPSLAKGVYENALKFMSQSESVREKLKVKKELNTLRNADVSKTVEKVVDKAKSQIQK